LQTSLFAYIRIKDYPYNIKTIKNPIPHYIDYENLMAIIQFIHAQHRMHKIVTKIHIDMKKSSPNLEFLAPIGSSNLSFAIPPITPPCSSKLGFLDSL